MRADSAFFVVLGLLAAACAIAPDPAPAAPGPIIDGFPIGRLLDCGLSRSAPCHEVLPLARAAFDSRVPDHPEILATSFFMEDINNPAIFDPRVLHARSGTLIVVVFNLADGSKHAAGVYCGVGGCTGLATYPR
jgi:hypothetical protein